MSRDAAAYAVEVESRLNVAADGKRFRCEFIREGPVNYPELGKGIECLRHETILEGLKSFHGKPLVIEHIDPRLNVADPVIFKRVAHGVIDKTGFDPASRWFFCEGDIFDDAGRDAAIALNPSCGFNVLATGPKGRWNNVPYERALTAIEFHHLALTKLRPRYEEADFRLNAVTNNTGEITMFKLLRKIVGAGGAAPTEETIELSPETEIDLGNGKKARLNAVVEAQKTTDEQAAAAERKRLADDKAAKDAEAARLNATLSDESEVMVGDKKVTIKQLKADYESRQNAVKAEADKVASEARENARRGEEDFAKLQRARETGAAPVSPYPKTAGGREESLKRGKY